MGAKRSRAQQRLGVDVGCGLKPGEGTTWGKERTWPRAGHDMGRAQA